MFGQTDTLERLWLSIRLPESRATWKQLSAILICYTRLAPPCTARFAAILSWLSVKCRFVAACTNACRDARILPLGDGVLKRNANRVANSFGCRQNRFLPFAWIFTTLLKHLT